jgi:Mn-dependent DtxR family transcriptional regulator
MITRKELRLALNISPKTFARRLKEKGIFDKIKNKKLLTPEEAEAVKQCFRGISD